MTTEVPPSQKANSMPAKPAASAPPIRPAQVLFGEMTGASLGPPIARPVKNAPVSADQTTKNR